MRPLIPTIMRKIQKDEFDVRWAWLKGKDGDWDPATGEIRLHWHTQYALRVFIHEALHDIAPRASERWIWERTIGVEDRITQRQKEIILLYLKRSRRAQRRREERLRDPGPFQKVHA